MAEQLITGEALYAVLLSANPDLAYTWRDLNTYDKQVYVEVATVVNGTYLAPLQGEIGQLRADFQRLKVMDGDIQKEQDAEIAHLERQNDACKAVLTSCRVFVSHDAPVLKRNREEWDRERNELIRMANLLLNGEQKEG